MKKINVVLILVATSMALGCQSTSEKKIEETIETNKQTVYLSEAKVALDELQLQITQAGKNNLKYFSPEPYEEALEAYQNGFSHYADIIKNGTSSLSFKSSTEQIDEAKQIILNYISQAKQHLQNANSIKSSAELVLAETFSQRIRLEELNVQSLYARDYKKITNKIDDLVELISEGEVTEAEEDQVPLLSKMVAMEIKAVKQIELGDLDKGIANVKKSRVYKLIPASYQVLLNVRKTADAVITTDPRDVENIKQAVDAVKYELAHAIQVADEVQKLKNIKSDRFESYVLSVENDLNYVVQALGASEVKNQSLGQQFLTVGQSVKELVEKYELAESSITNIQGASEQSNAQIKALHAQNTLLEDKYKALQEKSNNDQVELVKLQAFKEAVDSLGKGVKVNEETPVDNDNDSVKVESEVLLSDKPIKNVGSKSLSPVKPDASTDIPVEVSKDSAEIEAVVEAKVEDISVEEVNVNRETVIPDTQAITETPSSTE